MDGNLVGMLARLFGVMCLVVYCVKVMAVCRPRIDAELGFIRVNKETGFVVPLVLFLHLGHDDYGHAARERVGGVRQDSQDAYCVGSVSALSANRSVTDSSSGSRTSNALACRSLRNFTASPPNRAL